MGSIFFHYFFTLFLYFIFIIIGIKALKKSNKNYNIIIISIIFILIGSIKISNKIFNSPSISNFKNYYSRFQLVNINSIDKVKISTEVIEDESVKKSIIIIEKEKLNKIFFELKEINSFYFSFKRRGLVSSYVIEVISDKESYYFNISKYTDNFFYIDFYYVDKGGKKYMIGRYIKKVNKNSILTINSLIDLSTANPTHQAKPR